MSHELRTPLNAILGFGQILNRQDVTELQRESIQYILKGGRHLLELINEVLDIARIEAGRIGLSIEPTAAGRISCRKPARWCVRWRRSGTSGSMRICCPRRSSGCMCWPTSSGSSRSC